MRKSFLTLTAILGLAFFLHAAPSTRPNDREWSSISNDYAWLESLRKAQVAPSPAAPRKQQIQAMLANLQKIEPSYTALLDKVHDYYTRTADPRAAHLLAREKIILGDQYMMLSRYDRSIDLYKEALVFAPDSADAKSRIALAEGRRFISMDAFASVKAGMKEENARALVGYPREDWIKQVVQNNRAYSVWIYPKADGGAAAIYFDNGVVYHTNWNAAAPQQAAQSPATR